MRQFLHAAAPFPSSLQLGAKSRGLRQILHVQIRYFPDVLDLPGLRLLQRTRRCEQWEREVTESPRRDRTCLPRVLDPLRHAPSLAKNIAESVAAAHGNVGLLHRCPPRAASSIEILAALGQRLAGNSLALHARRGQKNDLVEGREPGIDPALPRAGQRGGLQANDGQGVARGLRLDRLRQWHTAPPWCGGRAACSCITPACSAASSPPVPCPPARSCR